jgi:hypothetical protein
MRQRLSVFGAKAIAFGILFVSYGISLASNSPTAAPWAS